MNNRSAISLAKKQKIDSENYRKLREQLLALDKNEINSQALLQKRGILTTILDRHMPEANQLAKSAIDTGSSVSSALVSSLHAAHTLSSGFRIGSLLLAALNFIRIPALYLVSWLAGEKPPITLSNNARWLYSGILLGLGILALAVPATAMPIAIGLASVGLATSLFSLGRFFYKRYQLPRQLRGIEQNLAQSKQELQDLQNELQKLERQQPTPENIELLYKAYQQQEKIQKLVDQKYKIEKDLKASGVGAFIDKSVGVGLASIAITGLALSLAFPTIGLVILAVSSSIAGLYILGRVGFKLGSMLNNYRKKKSPSLREDAPAEDEDIPSPKIQPDHKKSPWARLFSSPKSVPEPQQVDPQQKQNKIHQFESSKETQINGQEKKQLSKKTLTEDDNEKEEKDSKNHTPTPTKRM